MVKIPLIIIGGGIVGLSIGRELRRRYPDLEFAILEKESYLGEHSSGRNSGVLHAGIYYPKDSLKAKLCVEGNKLWDEWANELSVPILRCGKFIFARNSDEELVLAKIKEQALKNGVNLTWAKRGELDEISPYVNIVNALYSKTSAIIEVSTALSALKYDLESNDVPVMLNYQVTKIDKSNEGFVLKSNQETIECNHLINSAGLFAVGLRRQLGLYDIEDCYVKGCYLKTHAPFYSKSLLYPIPHHDLKGLGIHSTFDFAGVTRMGPNTIDVTGIDYSFPEDQIESMKEAIKASYKGMLIERFEPDFAGIRPKIRKDGKIFADFWIEKRERYIELLGIESPGLTSAPAIARYVSDLFRTLK